MEDRHDPQVREQIRAKHLRTVVEALPLSVVTALVVSVILAALHWPVIDQATIQVWILAVYLISAYCLLVALYFLRAEPPVERTDRWEFAIALGTALAALGWGAAAYFLFAPDSVPHQIVLAFAMVGVSVGGVASLAAMRRSAFAFILLVNIPLAYRFLEQSYALGHGLPLMVLVFIGVMLGFAHRFNRHMTDVIVERYEWHQSQQREQARNQVLQLVANGAPLKQILRAMVLGTETQHPGVRCSVFLLDRSGKRLFNAAASSLPQTYIAALDGLEIGPSAGSCGTAAFTGRRVIVEDVAQHPSWGPYRKVAAEAKIGSAWSEPVFSASGTLFGTVAMYRSEPHHPIGKELSALSDVASLAGIAIERRKTEDELRLAALVYEKSSEPMMIIDKENRIIAINPAFSKTTGYTQEEVIGQPVSLLNSDRHDQHSFASMWEGLQATGHWQGGVWNRRKNGDVCPEWLTVNTMFDAHGRVERSFVRFSDITKKEEAGEQIWTKANYDTLTHLPNRRLLVDRLEQEVRHATRARSRFAVLHIGLDRFKEVNDTLGHYRGDELLV